MVAVRGPWPAHEEIPLTRDVPSGRAVIDRETVHIPDVMAAGDEYPGAPALGLPTHTRAILVAPLVRKGEAIGTITIRRDTPGLFTDKQVQLLKTFAHQAVIAIENVRLFNETKEALEQQTATSEILRVISSSPTDLQPVFDAVAENAVRLCEASNVIIFRVDGDALRRVASVGPFAETIRPDQQFPMVRGSVAGRAIVDRRTCTFEDLASASDDEFPDRQGPSAPLRASYDARGPSAARGHAPRCHRGVRTEVRPFSDGQVSLLETFAAQGVIAIENVRLFTELQEKNRALTEAHAQVTESLEQQTATAEILRVISSSPTDLQPVMDVVAASGARFCAARDVDIFRLEGESFRFVARHGLLYGSTPLGGTLAVSPRAVGGRAVLDRRTIHVEDLLALPETEFPETLARMRRSGSPFRTMLATPLLREGVPIGLIVMRRAEVQPFTDKQIELAKTFADQAVIAIENVRLFTELQTRNAELAESLEQQTATAEILRVISRSPTDIQPVCDIIAANALKLCDAHVNAVTLYDGELLHLVALANVNPEGAEALRQAYPRRADWGHGGGRAVSTRAVVQIPDVLTDRAYELKRDAGRGLPKRSGGPDATGRRAHRSDQPRAARA